MQSSPQKNTDIKIICSDNLAALREFADNSIDSVVTDPPYGLGKEPDAMQVLKDWIDHGYHEVKAKGGFMGKSWDSFVPQPNFWKEVYRVLKPGGHVLSFGGTRTYDWMVMSLRLAGFEIRDQLQWIYGSGFPKSMDISKAIDKQAGAERDVIGVDGTRPIQTKGRINSQASAEGSFEREANIKTAPFTNNAKQWDGWGTALKPAVEPICLARKPIEENTIADNVIKNGTGALHIDTCRQPFQSEKDKESATFGRGTDIMGGNFVGATHSTGQTNIEANPKGRWPANVIFSHHPDCEYVGQKKVSGTCRGNGNAAKGEQSKGTVKSMRRGGAIVDRTDENGQEIIDQWNCHPDCSVNMLDQQSGILKTGAMKKAYTYTNTGTSFGSPSGQTKSFHKANEGGASRFFYCAKASRSERNKGLENVFVGHNVKFTSEGGAWQCTKCDRKYNYTADICPKCGSQERELYNVGSRPVANTHPTVKPVKLMQWLVKLITPPGGTCLDPFNGSGTTGIACKLEGFNYIGIDDIQEHCDTSKARIDAWQPEPEDYDNQLSFNFE